MKNSPSLHRPLGRKLAVEIPEGELESVRGGLPPREGSKTCDGQITVEASGSKDCSSGWDEYA